MLPELVKILLVKKQPHAPVEFCFRAFCVMVLAVATQTISSGKESFSNYGRAKPSAKVGPSVVGDTGNWIDVDFGHSALAVVVGSLICDDPPFLLSSGDKAGGSALTIGGEINATNGGCVYRLLDSSPGVTASTSGAFHLSFFVQIGQGSVESPLCQMFALFEGGAAVYNAYPLMETTAVDEGQRAQNFDKRVFIPTRSASAGPQRNAAVTCSGDIGASREIFAQQIASGLNFTATGIPYGNTDIDGFFGGDPATSSYAEFFNLWFQYGALNPMFRVHGTNFAKEVWRFPSATQSILIDYINLRYRLMPHIYSQAWKVSDADYTMMRPLVMDFRADPQANNINNQFTLGYSLLVHPVTTAGVTSREIYLPSGVSWFDFWTGVNHAGGQQITATAPIQTLPLYVRAGATLPYGTRIQCAEGREDLIELSVYPGADGSFTLHEDEGDNYNYESVVHATNPVIWHDAAKTLTIGARVGSFRGMLEPRAFRLVFVRRNRGIGLADTPPDITVTYAGEALSVEAPPVPERPAAPTGSTATSGAQIELTWDASAGEAVCRIKCSNRLAGAYSDIASVVSATIYADASVEGSMTYHDVITAVNDGGESPASIPVAAMGGAATLRALLMFNEATDTPSTIGADATGQRWHPALVTAKPSAAALPSSTYDCPVTNRSLLPTLPFPIKFTT